MLPQASSCRAAARYPPAEPLARECEETRSKLACSLVNEFALRAAISRGGSE
jgi:hypothetical protein